MRKNNDSVMTKWQKWDGPPGETARPPSWLPRPENRFRTVIVSRYCLLSLHYFLFMYFVHNWWNCCCHHRNWLCFRLLCLLCLGTCTWWWRTTQSIPCWYVVIKVPATPKLAWSSQPACRYVDSKSFLYKARYSCRKDDHFTGTSDTSRMTSLGHPSRDT